MSKKKIENPVPLDNLRRRRTTIKYKDNNGNEKVGYSQFALAELVGVRQETYCDYELGKKPIPSTVLMELSSVLQVSCDYILGVSDSLNIGNTEIEDMTGLTETAIETLRGFKAGLIEQLATAFIMSDYGITYTPYNPVGLLNILLSSPNINGLLSAIEDYMNPVYNKPMCYVAAGEKIGGVTAKKADYHIPQNQIYKRGNDNYIPLVRNEDNPTDYRAVRVNDSFLESVALLQIQKYIDTIKADYLTNTNQ